MSRDEYVVAVDAGSGSCRAAVFGSAGDLRGSAAEEWQHPAEPDVPGGRRFDTEGNWALVARCVRRALDGVDPAAVRAVATTSFRGGLVAFGADGRVLWACPNSDARAGAEARELVESGLAAELQARGGDWVSLTAPARIRWLRRHEPELWRRTAAIGLVGDWMTRELSGELVTDPSLGSSSGLFDLARRTWSAATLEALELDPALLPTVMSAGVVAGTVLPAAAAATGLAAGTPVVTGGADTPLGLVGLGVADAGRGVVLGGTHWQQSLTTAAPALDPAGRLRTLCHALDGQWLVEGIGFHCGLALRWFRDAFGGADYAQLEALAAGVPPGAEGVVAILANAMDARAWVHAPPAFAGFDLERPAATGRAAFVRAILEAAAYVARAHVAELETVAGEPLGTLLLAGGVARGRLWPQIVADVLGREVAVSDRSEATVRGAALAATVGAGWHRDLRSAARAEPAQIARTLTPDPGVAQTYDVLYARWRRVYAGFVPAAGDLAPLWRAPGI